MKTPDYTSEFPPEFGTHKRGILRLHLSSLMVGEEEAMKLCRYGTISSGGQIASFHPATEKPLNPSKWQAKFDRRFQRAWRGLLTANADVISERVRGWFLRDKSIGEPIQSLQMSRILISDDESVTLRFATSPMLEHDDLGVTFDRRSKIPDVEVEG